jgi:lambda family phage minor tail protein L
LFELQTTLELHGSEEIYRFHSGVNMRQANGDIIWNGNAYSKFPIEADGFEFNGKQMPRPTLRVANLFSSITAVLLNVNAVTPGNDLIGATVTRIRTCARYLDAVNFENNQNPFGSPDPTAEAPREIYKIDRKVSENRDLIEFELAAAIDLVNVSLPGRQCISSICQWKYRGPECGYTGADVFDELDEPANLVAATDFPAGTSSMAAGGELNVGDFLISSNRWYKLIMQADGNLVVYNKALKAVWSTLTYDKGASVFRYQEDGNLVIYDAFNRATWNSNTQNVASIDGTTFVKLLPDEYPTGDEASLPTIAATNFAAGTSSVLSTAAPRLHLTAGIKCLCSEMAILLCTTRLMLQFGLQRQTASHLEQSFKKTAIWFYTDIRMGLQFGIQAAISSRQVQRLRLILLQGQQALLRLAARPQAN